MSSSMRFKAHFGSGSISAVSVAWKLDRQNRGGGAQKVLLKVPHSKGGREGGQHTSPLKQASRFFLLLSSPTLVTHTLTT